MCKISQEALEVRNRASANKVNCSCTQCPGVCANKELTGHDCPYMQHGECQYLLELNKISAPLTEDAGLLFGYNASIRRGTETTPLEKMFHALPPQTQFDLMKAEDKFEGVSRHYHKEFPPNPAYPEIEYNLCDYPECAGLIYYFHDEIESRSNSFTDALCDAFCKIYTDIPRNSPFAGVDCRSEPLHYYNEEEVARQYEQFQYSERKALGEPVKFHNGRCMFDGYVLQHYLPGPVPGLQYYTERDMYSLLDHNTGDLVDHATFAKWLTDAAVERQQGNLPPVGFFGMPVCAVRAADIFKYNAFSRRIIGPRTYEMYSAGMTTPLVSLHSINLLNYAHKK